MTEDSQDNGDSEQSQESKDTEISASLAALDITVRTEGQEECEELFYRVWDYVNEDAAEMSEAMRERMGIN